MFDFKNCYENRVEISEPTSSSVTGKIKTDMEKNLHIRNFILYFSIFKCTAHRPI